MRRFRKRLELSDVYLLKGVLRSLEPTEFFVCFKTRQNFYMVSLGFEPSICWCLCNSRGSTCKTMSVPHVFRCYLTA